MILTVLVILALYALWRGWSMSGGTPSLLTGIDRSQQELEGTAFPRGKAYEGGEQDNKAGESAADVMRVLVHILQNHAERERPAA